MDLDLDPLSATRAHGDWGRSGELFRQVVDKAQINIQINLWNTFLPVPCKHDLLSEVVRSPRVVEAKGHQSGLP